MEHQIHLDKKQTIHFVFCILSNAIKNCQDNVLLDSTCGYDNFLQLQGFKRNIDIDGQTLAHVVNYLREYQNKLAQSPLLLHVNILHYLCRDNFKYRKLDYS